jgi:nucleotide-binding universal stress UspA family protein
MSKIPFFKKAVWAFDPFESDGETHRTVARTLVSLTRKINCSIKPVYVLSPDELNVQMALGGPWVKQYLPSSEEVMRKSLTRIKRPKLQEPEVIFEPAVSLQRSAKALLKYAKSADADLLVVGTHARKGIARALMGSFAETLMLQAKIPLLVVNPGTRPRPLKNILFPTDFSAPSKKAFEHVVRFARALNAKVTLLHVVPHPIEPVFQSGVYLLGGGWVSAPELIRKGEEDRHRIAEQWIESAAKSGVKAAVTFESGRNGVRQAVLARAKSSGAGMIAMAAESGTVASALLGSIARQVVREATCPVWILRA